MKNTTSGLLLVNLASLFISSSGILGKLIDLPPVVTSFFRSILGVLFLSLLILTIKGSMNFTWRRDQKSFIISGILLALHWSTYFYALQISNVSIAIISLFTYPIITTLIEPLFFQTRVEKINLLTSMLVLVGIVILVPEFSLRNDYTLGIVVGLLSALLYALRNLVSKKLVTTYSGDQTLVIQLFFAAILLSPSLFIYSYEIDLETIALLLVLGLITTAFGHTLFLMALRHLTTSSASVLASLQPVYAILLAVILIGEQLQMNVILGGILILLAVIIQNLWPKFKAK